MLSLVAIDTINPAVIGFGVRQVEGLLQMAGSAETGRNVAGRDNFARLVSRVAFQTIFCRLTL